jgi:hypothetical protein
VRARDVARAVSLGSPLAQRDAAEQVSQRTSKRGPTKGYVRSPDPWTQQLGEQPTALCATSWCDTATTTTLRSRRSAGPRSATGSTERSTVRPHRRGQRANDAAHCRAGRERSLLLLRQVGRALRSACDITGRRRRRARRPRHGRAGLSPMPAEILRPINASGESKSWSCLRPSPARSGVSTCELAKMLVHLKI